MNDCIFVGNLVSEPVYFENNVPRAIFRLAVDQNGRSSENGEKKTNFPEFVAWRHNASYIHQYCHTGDKLAIHVEYQTRVLANQDGETTYKHEFTVVTVEKVKTARRNLHDST